MDEGLSKFLQNTSWFSNLPADVINSLGEKVITLQLKENDSLIEIGSTGDSVFIIREGWVKIVIPDDKDGEIVLNHLGPGEFVGELSLVDQKPRSASVIAISEKLEALELHREDFLNLLNEFPMMALFVISNISNRMRYTLTYLDKAVHWSYKIAEGDYSFAAEEINRAQQSSIVDNTKTDETRADRFLLAFFKMVQQIQAREDMLIEKVKELSIKIDKDKRDKELDSLTGSSFFEKLQSDTRRIREDRRKDKK
ncbi:MAG: cyclic nucleotide-binding domain-containing protein [Chloroflexota bacterium]